MSKFYVPEVLILDVLSRLPAKTLLSFRRVSKSWCDLIESRYFSKINLNRLIATDSSSRIIVCGYSESDGKQELYTIDCNTKDVKELKYPPLKYNKDTGIELLGSINGIICLRYAYRKIVLLNPLSQSYIKISHPVISYPSRFHRSGAYGFAYDKRTNDYKVVSLVTVYDNFGPPVLYDCRIYSLKAKSWKRLENFAYEVQEQDGILVSGALHWITKEDLILSFDLIDEKFHIIPQFDYLSVVHVMNVGVLGDCLSVTVHNYISHEYEIWVMNDYGVKDSWTMINLGPRPYFVRPISYLKSNRQVIIEYPKEFLLYHLDNHSVEKIAAHYYESLKAYPYMETLECGDFMRGKTSKKSSSRKRIRD